jgi:nitroreductase
MSNAISAQAIHILNTIRQRRSVGEMTDQEPSREQIEQLLEAATYAPNHHVTEPWQFFVLTGAAREKLGRVMDSNKTLRSPVIITVAVEKVKGHEEFLERIEAASAAVQNMLLVAHEMGLAAIWRTGDGAYNAKVKHWFGLSSDDHIVAFVYLGYPTRARKDRVPTHFSKKTTWLS